MIMSGCCCTYHLNFGTCAAQNVKALSIRASCWMKKKSYQRAIEDYTIVLQSNGQDVPALFHRGGAYEKLGFTNEAIADYTRVLACDPNHVNAAYARAACYNRKGQFSEAIEDYNLALSKDKGRVAGGGGGLGGGSGGVLSSASGLGGGVLVPPTPGAMLVPGSPFPIGSQRKGSFRVGVEEYMRSREAAARERLSAATPLGMGYGHASSVRSFSLSASSIASPAMQGGKGGGGGGGFLGLPPAGAGSAVITSAADVDAATSGALDVSTLFPNRDDGSPSPSPTPSPPATPSVSDLQGRHHGLPVPRGAHGGSGRDAMRPSVAPVRAPALGGDGARLGGLASPAPPASGARSTAMLEAGAGAFRPRTSSTAQQQDAGGSGDGIAQSGSRAAVANLGPSEAAASPGKIGSPGRGGSAAAAAAVPDTPTVGAGAGSTTAEADAHHARGFALRRKGDFVGAIAQYSRAISLDPNHFKAYFNRGFAYDKLREFSAAIADYTRALEIDPRNAYAFYNRGISHDRSGAFDLAIADFTKAIALLPTNADFYHNRGFCYRLVGYILESCGGDDDFHCIRCFVALPLNEIHTAANSHAGNKATLMLPSPTTPRPLRLTRGTSRPCTTARSATTRWGAWRRPWVTTPGPSSWNRRTRMHSITGAARTTR